MSTLHAFAFSVALQVTILSVLSLAIGHWLCRSASHRHMVGVVALALLLFIPLATPMLPRRVWWPASTPTTGARVEPAPLAPVPRGEPKVTDGAKSEPIAISLPPPVAPPDETPRLELSADPEQAPEQGASLGWPGWPSALCFIWGIGVLVSFARHYRKQRMLRLIERSEFAWDDTRESIRPARDFPALGLASRPAIVVSPLAPMPMVVGLWRPKVVLPADFVEFATISELRNVVLHELAHIARRDPWVLLAQRLASLLYWWNPGVHALNRVIARSREEVCDNYVVKFGETTQYAQTLLDFAIRCTTLRSSVPSLGLLSTKWSLEDRIEGLLDPKRETETRTSFWKTMFTLATLVVAVLFVGGMGAADEKPSATNKPAVQLRKKTLVGKVVDDNGKPIEMARVLLYRYPSVLDAPILVSDQKSDTNGKFKFEDVDTAADLETFHGMSDLVVTATAPERTLGVQWETSTYDKEYKIVLSSKVGALTGVVRDSDGCAVPDATVYLPIGFGKPIPGFRSALTDKSGRFTLLGLREWIQQQQAGNFDRTVCFVYVDHPKFGLSHGEYTSTPSEIEIVLNPPAVIRGQVMDEVTGKPAANVLVSAQGILDGNGGQTKTDADGRYEMRLSADRFNIWAEMPDRIAIAVKGIAAASGAIVSDANIKMVTGGFVFGKILDGSGQPVRQLVKNKLRVAHYGPARPKVGAAVTSTLVKEDSTYRIRVAPGDNYIYLMNFAANAAVTVKDKEEVEVDLQAGRFTTGPDPERELVALWRAEFNREKQFEKMKREGKTPATKARPKNAISEKLDQFELLTESDLIFGDRWALQMMEIVKMGSAAVPVLCEKLDNTDSRRMLSSVAFMLRAIGDQRAIPALIRTIPKTLVKPSSDMGLKSGNRDVVAFMQKHDIEGRDEGKRFFFGRPVREVSGALRKLTGKSFGETELYHVMLSESSSQAAAQRRLYHNVAQRWADWWESNWNQHAKDPSYAKVGLAKWTESGGNPVLQPGAKFFPGEKNGNWILESVYSPKAQTVFYDLDTGRAAGVPEAWRGKDVKAHIREITAWASKEGFDLMGTQLASDGDIPLYAIQAIGQFQAFELGREYWNFVAKDGVTLEALQSKARKADELLLSVDPNRKTVNPVNPKANAPFLFITGAGSVGILLVGIEVHNDNLKPGGQSEGDLELSPIAFVKGRRFGYIQLTPRKQE